MNIWVLTFKLMKTINMFCVSGNFPAHKVFVVVVVIVIVVVIVVYLHLQGSGCE